MTRRKSVLLTVIVIIWNDSKTTSDSPNRLAALDSGVFFPNQFLNKKNKKMYVNRQYI